MLRLWGATSVSGEIVECKFDTLCRLTRAETTGPQWGLSFSYDVYGNRLTQAVVKGSGPAASTPVYPTTNRLQDANIDYTVYWDTTHVWFASASQASVGFFGLDNPNRLQSKGTHYPYGEQKAAYPPSFATYTRDTFTNLDYAINRCACPLG